MSGAFSVGGLITGLDSGSIIQQLIAIERQPVTRIQQRIDALTARKNAVRDLRLQLQTLRNRAQDLQFAGAFKKFESTSSAVSVLTTEISGENPVVGSYNVQVLQLASATTGASSAPLGSAINPGVALNSSGIGTDVSAGTFTINGVQFTVNPASDSLNNVLSTINASSAGVTATYNPLTDKVSIENSVPGNTNLINLGATADTSNFLSAINVSGATQTTGGSGSTIVTSTKNLGAIEPGDLLNTVNFAGGAATSGTFFVNGISISVDVTTDSLSDVIEAINSSDAQVTASYDSTSDTIRVVSKELGSRTINFQAGTSNFLNVTNLTTATQAAGTDSQFKVNGGATLTRNTNDVSDAIGGVTLRLLSVGTSTVTVDSDEDAVLEGVQKLVDEFNKSLENLRSVTGSSGQLENDGSIREIENFLRDTIFKTVSGITGNFASLLDLGISTGDTFDSEAVAKLTIDVDAFKEALRDDPTNVEAVFTNSGETGIIDQIEAYLEEVTGTNGFLNDRIKSNGTIDSQVESYEDQIERLESRIAQKEARLKKEFARLEQLSASYQQQGSALTRLGGGLSSL
jgi:flagellar hook-associated protein 2